NTLLATLISYSNEMSLIADKIGEIDVANSFRILHMDKRLSGSKIASYIYPGCGYGGYCLPKDTNAIYALTKNKGFDPLILKNVIETNDKITDFICRKVMEKANKDDRIGILGLSFKPNSDDVRDTPAIKIIRDLKKHGYENICAYDPIAIQEFKNYYPDVDVDYLNSYKDIINESKVLVIVTAWNEFKNIRNLTDKPVIDGRYML
ncbi:MAG: UDP binding domain-containing protein, partial [Athalassotoga sp.]